MKSILAVAALASVLGTAAIPANAFPLMNSGITITDHSNIVHVGWRCGPHRHWSWRWHHCVWNR